MAADVFDKWWVWENGCGCMNYGCSGIGDLVDESEGGDGWLGRGEMLMVSVSVVILGVGLCLEGGGSGEMAADALVVSVVGMGAWMVTVCVIVVVIGVVGVVVVIVRVCPMGVGVVDDDVNEKCDDEYGGYC